LTFSVLLHSVGGDAEIAELFPVGPRQCPQLSALTLEVTSNTANNEMEDALNMKVSMGMAMMQREDRTAVRSVAGDQQATKAFFLQGSVT
jgi:hypothetical protein